MKASQPELSTAKLRIMTVCTGNICRSPMAEAILRKYVDEAGMAGQVAVDSSGTHGYHVGEDADPRAYEVLGEAGYALRHRARRFDPRWLTERDLILAMDGAHLAHLQALAAQHRAPADTIVLMRQFDPTAPPRAQVADPYYDTVSAFRSVRTQLERACPGVITHLQHMLNV